jgi:hypothetical protein
MLPDVALINVFEFYMDGEHIEVWHTLVHVCLKWRNIVFGSPRRLNLRLYCKAETPVRKTLDAWPMLPIVVSTSGHGEWGMDNLIAALEHNDRICRLDALDAHSSQFKKVWAAMEQPFPALTHLKLRSRAEAPVIPDSFLGGFAPRLRTLFLERIPFPGLPKLLLSATHLVHLYLWNIPDSVYISPKEMVTGLSASTGLKDLVVRFENCFDQKRRCLPPETRTLLSVLTNLRFFGTSKYLEDLVAQMEAPRLRKLAIVLFPQVIFDTPQLAQFISRTPKFKTLDKARVFFSNGNASVKLPQTFDGALRLSILQSDPSRQLSSLTQVFNSSFPQALISAVEHLYVLEDGRWWSFRQNDIEISQWLGLFHSFTSVKDIYISSIFARDIALALQELVGERVTGVLPDAQHIAQRTGKAPTL